MKGWTETKSGKNWMVDLDAGRERFYSGTRAGIVLLVSKSVCADPDANKNQHEIADGDRIIEAFENSDPYSLPKGIKFYRLGYRVS